MPKFKPPLHGDLRVHIAIQSLTRTPDGAGSFSEQWTDALETWASFEAWKGTKQVQAMQIQPQQWWDVVTRFSPSLAVTKGMRLKDLHTGELYEIYSAADPDRHRHWLWIMAFSSAE